MLKNLLKNPFAAQNTASKKQKKLDHPDHSLRSGRHWINPVCSAIPKAGRHNRKRTLYLCFRNKNQLVNNIEMKKDMQTAALSVYRSGIESLNITSFSALPRLNANPSSETDTFFFLDEQGCLLYAGRKNQFLFPAQTLPNA